MDLGLKDRVYVVTGATRGLGNAAARELLADGAKVVVTGRDEKRAADAAAELGPNAVGVAVDNADAEAPARLIAAAREHFGGFEGILVSVGGPPPGFVADTTDEQWQTSFESVFLGAVRARPRGGRGAGAGRCHRVRAVRFGARADPRADDLQRAAARSRRVREVPRGRAGAARHPCRGAAPGPYRHGPGARAGRPVRGPAGHACGQRVADPLRRYGSADEFGRVAAFLLSPAASYLTGIMVPVDGGMRHGF